MKFFYYLFISSLFFLLSCMGGDRQQRPGYEDRRKDTRGNLDTEDRRKAEIRRLKGGDKRINAELERRYDGGFYYEGYGVRECREYEKCMDICDSRIVPSESRRKCYNSPRALIEKLEDGLRSLRNISVRDKDVNIPPALLAGILDLNVDLVTDLVEEKMSEGDLKSLLAWVALEEDIAEVFLKEDRGTRVMEEAFEVLGDLQPDAREEKETGLNTGLIHRDDSFFYLAAAERNEAAFKIAYEVLESACSSKTCKLNILCARELKSRRRSRIFGSERTLNCRTAASQGRRSRREGICYIHGATAWSYLNDLIEDEEIRERDFEGQENEVTVDVCNSHCGDEDDTKCDRIQ